MNLVLFSVLGRFLPRRSALSLSLSSDEEEDDEEEEESRRRFLDFLDDLCLRSFFFSGLAAFFSSLRRFFAFFSLAFFSFALLARTSPSLAAACASLRISSIRMEQQQQQLLYLLTGTAVPDDSEFGGEGVLGRPFLYHVLTRRRSCRRR